MILILFSSYRLVGGGSFRNVECFEGPTGDHLQHSNGPHTAFGIIAFFALPCSTALLPPHRVQECCEPTTRVPGTPFPAGPRSLTTQRGVVLHPSHFAVTGIAVFGATLVAGAA